MKEAIIPYDINGKLVLHADFKRLEKAKWYQKVFSFFSTRYKNKFIDLKPFEITNKN